jgi:isopenicillin N synthase-like dioxygenase
VTASSRTVIDLARAEAGDPAALGAVLRAGEDLGILQFVNHGVDDAVIDGFHDRMAAILARPRHQKIPLASPTGHPYRGWRQWPDESGRLELERFCIGQFEDPEEALAAGVDVAYAGEYAHPNVWPHDEPRLRGAARAYHDAAVDLARRVVGVYALALGQAPDIFPVGAGPDYTLLKVNNYPTWTDDADIADDQKLLLLEHADGSVVTVLHQRGEYDGLQGQRADGRWVSVPVVAGALQVFTGYLLTRWTNGRLRPGRHRVVAGGTVTRLSSAMFWHPRVDMVVEPLAPFVGPDGANYDPILVWDTVKDSVEDYLDVFGRPDQVAAWRQGRPYVAALAEA